jgi:hypothetical protein
LAAVLGADGSARGWRSAPGVGVRDSLGTWRDRWLATLLCSDFTVSGAIDQSEYVLRDEEYVGSTESRRFVCMIPYAPDDVSRYLSKGRFSSAADCESANTYELRKFDRAGSVQALARKMREARTVAIRMSPLSS